MTVEDVAKGKTPIARPCGMGPVYMERMECESPHRWQMEIIL